MMDSSTKGNFQIMTLVFNALILFMFSGCLGEGNDSASPNSKGTKNLPLEKIKLPEGFSIDVFAEVNNARSLCINDDASIVFVGNRSGDKVYAVRDLDKDNFAEDVQIIDEDLNMPNGVAFRDGDLFVAEVNRILKYTDIESKLKNSPEPEVVYDDYPDDAHHGWKYIAFGPDGLLYVPVGAPCNNCVSDDIYASITRINVKNPDPEIFAKGVRNTVGITWHPETKEMWFTDNGRDMLGDDIPPCELNYAPKKGMNFGYPYCHGGTVKDPEYGDEFPCSDFVAPTQNLGPHVAPLGLKFYTGNMFPSAYKNTILIAEHGSWNRSVPIGYRISMVSLDGNRSQGYATFAEGWLNENGIAWGRPVDVLVMPDGALLVSDDRAGVIYRITYSN